MKKIIVLLSLIIANQTIAAESVKNSIKKLNWNGIDVVYLEDNRFPTYDMVIYFADGALSDGKLPGLTQHALNLIDSGTSKLSQKEILDQIDFLGTEVGFDVTHEYTTFNMAGLSKDLKTALGQTCSLFREASYPIDVVKSEIEKEKSGLKTLVSSPQALAERVYREVQMGQTPYSYPVSGKLKDLDSYTSNDLRTQADYFFNKVKKRIYITGPKSVLEAKDILIDVCKFKGSSEDFERKITYQKKLHKNPELVFVPVPDANQVQVKIGRFLNSDEISDRNLALLASDFLGGGFTSKLMREVRVKRGLTYSIGAFISSQKEYGRAGISTFTKNETVNRLLEVIDGTVTSVKKGVTADELERTVTGLIGSHPFNFESNKAFLVQLLYLDHVGRDYDELFKFSDEIKTFSAKDVQAKIDQIFNLNKQTIFILGDKSLEKKLRTLPKKFGKLKIVDYKEFI